MGLARSLARVGRRRVVLARRAVGVAPRGVFAPAQAAQQASPSATRPFGTPVRSYQVAAARSAVPTSGFADAIAFPASSGIEAPAQGSREVLVRLAAVRDILEDDVGGSAAWVEVVNRAAQDVQVPRTARMGVWGDALASPSTFVSALLADPLSEDAETAEALLARHAGGQGGESGSCIIRHVEGEGTGAERRAGSAEGHIPWLRDARVDVVEIAAVHSASALAQLLATDFPVLVLDPIRMLDAPGLASLLPHLVHHPALRLIVNGAPPASGADGSDLARARLERQLRPYVHRALVADLARGAILVDARAGLQAAAALRDALVDGAEAGAGSERQRGAAWGTYQARFVESNMGEARAVLGSEWRRAVEVVGARGQPGLDPTRALQEQTAGYVASAALAHVQGVLGELEHEVQRAEDAAGALRRMADDTAHTAFRHATQPGDVAGHLAEGRRAVQAVWRGRLAWWRVVIGGGAAERSVDELEEAVRGRWAVDLGNRLSYDSGVLGTMQSDLSSRVDTVLASFSPSASALTSHSSSAATNSPTHPFHSALLLNALARLAAQHTIAPALLLPPITQRRDQLLSMLVPAVQAAGTRLLWQTYSVTFLAASLAWSATVPLHLVSGATGWATFLLLAAGTARWSVGRWARAQAAFWKGWGRMEAGLEEDVRASLESVVQGRLVGKAEAAARGLDALVQARRGRIEGVRGKVERLVGGAAGSGWA